ncbi:hypothetical protein FSP39_020524 [Pinctada imbricata]|uniref:Uncharacterized protein n=1 Tax=Pinctada imbricata TaxID=66713 RepID=A0AA88YE16_PINIB|nr:hypothetical protein FSP39_020524 [Pinctada imbricata]
MDNIQQGKVDQFTGVTGADAGRAKFYLESSGWNLELAIQSFFEHGDDDDDIPPEAMSHTAASQPLPTVTGAPVSGGPPPKSTAPKSRFGTIQNLDPGESDSSEDSDEGQAFYAGGSEHSGQQVLGPPKKKTDSKKIVDNLFKSAKEHGAEEVGSEAGPSKPNASKFAFRGAGYKLGDTEDAPSSMIQGRPLQQGPKQVDMVLKLWKDGFSVDDGPLRDFKDPQNKEFLDSISKGEVPRELISQAKGGEVNLNMEDHRTEDYVKPKVTMKAFSGAGHMLGSPAPNVVATSQSTGGTGSESSAQQAVSVNTSQPTTNLQIRLADGSRLSAKMNHTHKVSDVRRYITTARPEYATANFVLMTTFPNKELTNEDVTLKDANLLNAVIVQRIK